MVKRVTSTKVRQSLPRVQSTKAGRPGRRLNGTNSMNRLAIKKAKARGLLPAELLHDWCLKGKMWHGGEWITLDMKERIECAKAAAPYYSARLQPIAAPGEEDKPKVIKLDFELSQIREMPLDKLVMLREVLKLIAVGGGLTPELVHSVRPEAQKRLPDPRYYEKSLSSNSPIKGSA